MMDTVRKILFDSDIFNGCSDGNCIIKKPVGMHTNASCRCLHNLSRAQLSVLKSRLATIIDKEVDTD